MKIVYMIDIYVDRNALRYKSLHVLCAIEKDSQPFAGSGLPYFWVERPIYMLNILWMGSSPRPAVPSADHRALAPSLRSFGG